ncbi:class I SAM-dependent methyltransferase [Thiolapillus sp.]
MNAAAVIVLSTARYAAESEALAHRLGCALVASPPVDGSLFLEYHEDRLQLCQSGTKAPGPVYVDFCQGKAAHRRRQGEGRRSPLARAVGMKPGYTPRVVDATAGLGRDAFVLATLGCQVQMMEQSPVVHALLEDGLRRARQAAELAEITDRLTLVQGDAIQLLDNLKTGERPDSIYLDPMYPHKSKTALAKKEMRTLQLLLGPDRRGSELLMAARHAARRRTAVKRPAHAPVLGDTPPDFRIRSPRTRYDIYLSLPESQTRLTATGQQG